MQPGDVKETYASTNAIKDQVDIKPKTYIKRALNCLFSGKESFIKLKFYLKINSLLTYRNINTYLMIF